MARRSQKTEGFLTQSELDNIIHRVECMRIYMLSHCTDVFTHDDYYNLFVPSELHQAFRDVVDHAILPAYYENSFRVFWPRANREIEVIVNTYNDRKRPLIMKSNVLQPSAPQELVDRVTSIVTERWLINTDFSRVKAVIHALNKYCDTASQMRICWPQIVTLASRAELSSLLEKMQYNPRELGVLPVAVRKACQKAAITITQAQLLSDVERPILETALSFRTIWSTMIEDDFKFDISE